MQGNLVDDRVPERCESPLEGTSAVEHPPDQLAFAPAEPAHAPSTPETMDAEHAPAWSTPPDGRTSPRTQGGQDWLRRRRKYVIVPLLLLLVLAVSIGGGIIGARLVPAQGSTTPAQTTTAPPSVTDVQQAVETAVQSVQPSVVQVRSVGSSSGALGSAVILTRDGYIATNDHVVHGFRTYTVRLSNGQSLAAQLVGEDVQNDLAVLKVAASNLTPITFADSTAVKDGQFVVAVGSPMGLAETTTFGIVSALNRTVIDSSDGSATIEYTGMIQLDMTLNPGNSGGALIDMQGRLIGMPNLRIESTSSGVDVDGMGFAIPANRIKVVTTQLMQAGSPRSAAQASRLAR